MLKILAILAFLPLLAGASADLENFSYLYAGKKLTAKVGEIEGIKVNDVCLQAKDSCSAIKMLHGKSRIKEIHNAVSGNFAGAYCELLSGTQLFMKREGSENASQFCVFKDLTMIDARALYKQHSELKTSKQ